MNIEDKKGVSDKIFIRRYVYVFLFFLLIGSLFTNIQNDFVVDLGTDYAGVLDTENSYSNTSVDTVYGIGIAVLLIGIVLLVVYGYCKEHKDNLKDALKNLFIVVFIISILAIYASNNAIMCVHRIPGMKEQKECYSNIRVLLGAIEMYNMDVRGQDMIENFDGNVMETLYTKRYLKDKVQCPYHKDTNNYINLGKLSEDGVICCGEESLGYGYGKPGTYHGTIDGRDPTKNI